MILDLILLEKELQHTCQAAQMQVFPLLLFTYVQAGGFLVFKSLVFVMNSKRHGSGLICFRASVRIRQFCNFTSVFSEVNDVVREGVRICFPHVPSGLERMCIYLLASLVYHSSFLRQVLPNTHLLLQQALFARPDLVTELKSRVGCRCSMDQDLIRPTRISPHIGLLLATEN